MIHLNLDLDYLATKLRKPRHHGSCSSRSGHFSAECLQETFQECTIPIKPIIVKFTNRNLRNSFLVKAKTSKLKCNQLECTKDLLFSSNSKIFVNDHLTPANKKLFFETRKCVKEKKAKSAWTRDGKIFLRRDEMSAPIRISDNQDLQTFLSSINPV
ncbi:hypothetical protein M8J76_016834 [Diaphorina citri]|nr:hypothetical protein M8J76_016834 [Diaphorina citri]